MKKFENRLEHIIEKVEEASHDEDNLSKTQGDSPDSALVDET